MCQNSSSSLHFGACLSAFDLIRAASIFSSFTASTLTLSLIQYRLLRSLPINFSPPHQKLTLASLPVEVLTLIKSHLMKLLLRKTKSYFNTLHYRYIKIFEKSFCLGLTNEQKKEWRKSKGRKLENCWNWREKHWEIHDAAREGEGCVSCEKFMTRGQEYSIWGEFDIENEIEPDDKQRQQSQLRELVKSYGLVIPSFELFNKSTSTKTPSNALHLGFFVSTPTFVQSPPSSDRLPISDITSSQTSNYLTDLYEKPTRQTATTFYPSFFKISPEYHLPKFEKLMKDYGIHFVGFGTEGINFGLRDKEADAEDRRKKVEEKKKELKEIKKEGSQGKSTEEVLRVYDRRVRLNWIHLHWSEAEIF